MKIIYTTRTKDFERGKNYRNPQFFDGRPERGVESVVVEGDWPEVVESYEAAGIEVTSDKPKKAKRKKAEPTGEQD